MKLLGTGSDTGSCRHWLMCVQLERRDMVTCQAAREKVARSRHAEMRRLFRQLMSDSSQLMSGNYQLHHRLS